MYFITNKNLVVTESVFAKFSEIVDTVAGVSEKERVSALFGGKDDG